MSDVYYGIYRGICKENEDPENYKRIKLLVPQVLGNALSEWAWPCLPVTSNSNHPDHQEHTAAQIAAMFAAHGGRINKDGGGPLDEDYQGEPKPEPVETKYLPPPGAYSTLSPAEKVALNARMDAQLNAAGADRRHPAVQRGV